jgi:phage protein D/phage baseplate assembly protein gpV
MASVPSIPSVNGSNPPTHTVSVKFIVEGKEITQDPAGLMSLSIYKEFNKIPTAKVIISDGKVEKGSFDKSGSAKFRPGKNTDIQLGYQNETDSIFKGIIVKHAISASTQRASVLELECKDPAIKMALVRRSRYFANKTDTDVFKEILGDYRGKGVEIGNLADTDFEHPELVQYHCTDWDFLVLRAEANGLVVVADKGTINIVRLQAPTTADHTITWGDNIISFEAQIDARSHYPEVEAATWDNSKQEVALEDGSGNSGSIGGLSIPSAGAVGNVISSAASAVGLDIGPQDDKHDFPEALYGNTKFRLFHGGDMATKELSAWAKGQKKRSELSQVRGRVQIRGKDVKPNEAINLQRVGARFNGKHLISSVMHQLYEGTWRTDIEFGVSIKTLAHTAQDIAMPEASGLMASIKGLHVGVVTKIGGDEEGGHHRIKVKIPYIAAQGGDNEGIWARLATLFAGKERGSVFRPELKDEVILGFINDDPNDAVILGALHSSKNAAPIPADDKNNQKGFFAKEGMKLVFDDKKKSIAITTKNDLAILINENEGELEIKDKNTNSIKLSSKGIDLKSTKDIIINATGDVRIKGKEVHLNSPI